eukprot:CAMPEP_0114540450 /NCGR_PEP_ID=MMETSP0114-20121206/775_1 /TAXON_ID=31324 /ORGANISM="Goniomonas sp, Strain m" /LENGTH=199 /DNA_ID=CAMNT_0001724615 /DNA_START=293 /DNA_END=892 /DNA_ORIENTATION=-
MTGNGYFASWGAFFSSVALASSTVGLVRSAIDRATAGLKEAAATSVALASIFVASTIELVAAAEACDKAASCEKQYAWAVAVGCLAIFFSLIQMVLSKFVEGVSSRSAPVMAAIFLALWVPGVGVLTFDRPFPGTGNGYFSSWVALIASIYYASLVIPFIGDGVASARNAAGQGSLNPPPIAGLDVPPAAMQDTPQESL